MTAVERARTVGGFTLLEVLVALAILGLAVVATVQLFSQGLRLLKTAGDHQRAVLLAHQKVQEAALATPRADSGQEGGFAWQRRVDRHPVPDTLTPSGTTAAPVLRISVEVTWDRSRSVEVATLWMPPATRAR